MKTNNLKSSSDSWIFVLLDNGDEPIILSDKKDKRTIKKEKIEMNVCLSCRLENCQPKSQNCRYIRLQKLFKHFGI